MELIARQADGSMRDALSIMEKLMISCRRLTIEHVKKCLCLMDDDVTLGMLSAVIKADSTLAIGLLRKLYEEGTNLSLLVDNILQCLADGILLYVTSGDAVLHHMEEYKSRLYQIVRDCRIELLYWYVEEFSTLREKTRNSLDPYMDVLVSIIRCCNPRLLNDSASSLLARISGLEQEVVELRKGICPAVSPTDDPAISNGNCGEEGPCLELTEKEDGYSNNTEGKEMPADGQTDEASQRECPGEAVPAIHVRENPIHPTEMTADDYDVLGLLSDYL